MAEIDVLKPSTIIKKRIKEFETLGNKGEVVFDLSPFLDFKIGATIQTELAFCISTANSSAMAGLKLQKALEDKQLEQLTREQLQKLLKDSGVRFHNRKAVYIQKAVDNFDSILQAVEDEGDSRDYLVKNVKGLGLKEASHFLRNTGVKDVAIVDRHITRCLIEEGNLTQSNSNSGWYIECEQMLQSMAYERDMTTAELDLHLWFDKTGKILK